MKPGKMILSRGSKVVIVLALLSVSLFTFMLYFRAAIYPDMYIAPGQAYGAADLVEFFLGCLFITLTLVSGIVSLVLFFRGLRQSKILAGALIFLHGVMYISLGPLHTLVAHSG